MKKIKILALLLACTTLFTACGTKANTEKTITTEDGKIVLCNYKNLTGEKKIYKITEEMIDEAIEEMIYDYIDYKKVDRASKEGDILYTKLKVSIGDETLVNENDYEILVGDNEFGEEFDQKITGINAGKKLTFSLTYPDDSELLLPDNTALAGQTAKYQVTITKVTEEVIPSLTDDFIQNELGFESKVAMRSYIQTELTEHYETESTTELRENLLHQVIDQSTVTKYSDELFEESEAAVYEGYQETADMFGFESCEALFEEWEISDETLKEEILDLVYRTIVVQAICKENNITINDEELSAGIETYTEQFDYESTEALINDYGEDTLRIWLIEDKVMDILYENATITEIETSVEDE